MTFKGKKFVITGGSIGIGRQLAEDLAEKGAEILVCARNAGPLDALKADVPSISTLVCDVTKEDDVEALREATVRKMGTPDFLVNNAALFQLLDLHDQTAAPEQWLREIDVNLKGTLRVTHAFLPMLLAAPRATIINFTSPAGFVPLTAAPIYSASKAGITSWSQSLRFQLKDTNVSVVEIAPPVVDTRMNQNNPSSDGMKKWPLKDFSVAVLSQLARSQEKDILVGDAKLAKRFSRLMPSLVFSKMNSEQRPH